MHTLVRWLGGWEPKDKIVRVKSWTPTFDKQGMWWPTVSIDRNGYRRETSTPLWPWPWRAI